MAIDKPELYRVISLDDDLKNTKTTDLENQFLTFLFLHMTCAYELANDKEVITIEGMRKDVHNLLQAPIVCNFWESKKPLYNVGFASFVDSCLSDRT